MVAKKLLIASALIETAAGLMLLVSPPLVVALLLGASLDVPAAGVVKEYVVVPGPVVSSPTKIFVVARLLL